MRFIYVTVLSLLSGGQSAPVQNCESLTEQLEIQAQDEVRHLYLSSYIFACVQYCWMWFRIAEGETFSLFQVLGKWIAIAESTDVPESKVMTGMFVDSSWVELTATNQSDTVVFFQAQKRSLTLELNLQN